MPILSYIYPRIPMNSDPSVYNSGIVLNKQNYQPSKTLVRTTAYTFDIYENQVLIGFLKTIVNELNEMKRFVVKTRDGVWQFPDDGEYLDSAIYVFTKNKKMLDDYETQIEEARQAFLNLYRNYNRIYNINADPVFDFPKYTNIFGKIAPYHIVFEKITDWFSYGNYNLARYDLLFTFISLSRIYEYFCLISINKAIEKCGYTLRKSSTYKYTEIGSYQNTQYNNTFEYGNGESTVTVYYQPVIYNGDIKYSRTNEISIYRATSIKFSDFEEEAYDDETERSYRPGENRSFYTPDYIIKIQRRGQKTKYYILDAKHSTFGTVKNCQIPKLAFKYLFSLSPFDEKSVISGMCVLCGKETNNDITSIFDHAERISRNISPDTVLLPFSNNDDINQNNIKDYIANIL